MGLGAMMDRASLIAPAGFAALRAEYDVLLGGERLKLVAISYPSG